MTATEGAAVLLLLAGAHPAPSAVLSVSALAYYGASKPVLRKNANFSKT